VVRQKAISVFSEKSGSDINSTPLRDYVSWVRAGSSRNSG